MHTPFPKISPPNKPPRPKIIDLTLPVVFNDQDAVKIMAKDLVRTRKYVKKFMLMRTNIQAVSLRIQVW